MPYDWKAGATGAGTGAIYGSQIGSVVPGIGTGIGAAIGGGLGLLGGFFGGEKNQKKPKSVDLLDPNQRGLYDQKVQALQGGGGPLADVYGQSDPKLMRDYYEKSYAQPQYQEFQENVVPTITGQFRGNNLQNSSYLGGALGKAGSTVQNNLNGQMAQLLYQNEQSSLNRRASGVDSVLGLNSQVVGKPQASIFDSLLGSLSEGAGDILADIIKKKKKPALDDNFADDLPSSSGTDIGVGG